jgi:hypothetical protein
MFAQIFLEIATWRTFLRVKNQANHWGSMPVLPFTTAAGQVLLLPAQLAMIHLEDADVIRAQVWNIRVGSQEAVRAKSHRAVPPSFEPQI